MVVKSKKTPKIRTKFSRKTKVNNFTEIEEIKRRYNNTIYPRITSPKINKRRPLARRPNDQPPKINRLKTMKQSYSTIQKAKRKLKKYSNKKPSHTNVSSPLDSINYPINLCKMRRPNNNNPPIVSPRKPFQSYELLSFRRNAWRNINILHNKPPTPLRYRNKPASLIIEIKPFIQDSPCMPRKYSKPKMKQIR
ncbi:unnamed protein product [Phyllotreta striolata]|uniref:Uncharacterized protein n=1 Tax=Phyllotreta striolata TaxID=444603 RepID=A0A9N9TPX1_PHYSR|nr:unnamed protein product [Phyllotreta striolata]